MWTKKDSENDNEYTSLTGNLPADAKQAIDHLGKLLRTIPLNSHPGSRNIGIEV